MIPGWRRLGPPVCNRPSRGDNLRDKIGGDSLPVEGKHLRNKISGDALPVGNRRSQGKAHPILSACLVCFLAGLLCAGEESKPYAGYLFPAGGAQGSTVTVTLGGENLHEALSVIVTGEGVTAELAEAKDIELTPAQIEERKRKKRMKRTVLDESVKIRLKVAAGAQPGERNLFLVTGHGVANPRIFQIGQLPEITEVEPNDAPDQATPIAALPATVNGQLLQGDLDRFRFHARLGQAMVIEVSARALIPYIADAVPGWFQAQISLSDAKGQELAHAGSFRFNPDPVLLFDIPADGEYTLAITDALHRGRQDFTYRIRLGELPFVTGVFPLGARRGGDPVTVALTGRNLAEKTLRVSLAPDALATAPIFVSRDGVRSNPIPFAADDLPEIAGMPAPTVQPPLIDVPSILNGLIRAPGAKNRYRFNVSKGQALVCAVRARVLGSPLDSLLILRNAQGAVVAENDDAPDPAEGLLTHQADSRLSLIIPEDGEYTLTISDTQGKGGEDFSYRLRVSPPRPGFDLRAVPSSLAVSRGGSVALLIHALRQDGFRGAITLALDPAAVAAGLCLDGGRIPAGVDRLWVTVSARADATAATLSPTLVGSATIEDATVVRPLVPAEDLMQAFLYRHLVPSRAQVVDLAAKPAPYTITWPTPGGCTLPSGKETTLPVGIVRTANFDGPVQIQGVNLPKGVTVRRGHIPAGQSTGQVVIRVERSVEVGQRDNLNFAAVMAIERPATPQEQARRAAQLARQAADKEKEKAELVKAEAMKATAAKAETAKLEAAKPEATKVDKADPTKLEPTKLESAKLEIAKNDPVKPDAVLPMPSESQPARPTATPPSAGSSPLMMTDRYRMTVPALPFTVAAPERTTKAKP